MTNKDLNLSLQQRPPEPGARRRHAAKPKPAKIRGRPAPAVTPLSPPAGAVSSGTGASGGKLTMALLVMTVVNTLLLGAAGYWVYLHHDRIAAEPAPQPPAADPAIVPALDLLAGNLGKLETQLEQVQLGLTEQQRVLISGLLDLEERVATLQAVVKTPAPALATVAPGWVINAGNYANRADAESVVEQLAALGHQARLGAADSSGEKVQRVQITGFADRKAAEAVAATIVEQTDLNGLWVWKDD